MPESGRGADRAATDCEERLIASELDNDGQEDAFRLREGVLPIWRVSRRGPACAARAVKAERGADAGPAAPRAPP